jgi:hypothetical protein
MKYLINLCFALTISGLLFIVKNAVAEPYLAVKTGAKCSACHINPLGGGQRTKFGNVYGHIQLPKSMSNMTNADIGKLTDYLSVGGNFRYNAQASRDNAETNSSTFRVDSAQVYVTLQPKDSKFTFYIDQQIAPGAAINREAFVMYKFSGNHYVKAGKMYVPYGWRLEDDTSFVRQVTGFNFDSSDNGIELGLEYDKTIINFFVTNGTSSVANNDDNFLYGAKFERLFDAARIGSTIVVNSADRNEQRFLNVYGGWSWKKLALLAEANIIQTSQDADEDIEEFVSLIEANYEVMKGLNLKLTGEYYDPDRDISNNEETRYSIVVEYAPISNLQLRSGVRSSEGIPQQPSRTSDFVFFQTHVYF